MWGAGVKNTQLVQAGRVQRAARRGKGLGVGSTAGQCLAPFCGSSVEFVLSGPLAAGASAAGAQGAHGSRCRRCKVPSASPCHQIGSVSTTATGAFSFEKRIGVIVVRQGLGARRGASMGVQPGTAVPVQCSASAVQRSAVQCSASAQRSAQGASEDSLSTRARRHSASEKGLV
jgi:hypothetical protein